MTYFDAANHSSIGFGIPGTYFVNISLILIKAFHFGLFFSVSGSLLSEIFFIMASNLINFFSIAIRCWYWGRVTCKICVKKLGRKTWKWNTTLNLWENKFCEFLLALISNQLIYLIICLMSYTLWAIYSTSLYPRSTLTTCIRLTEIQWSYYQTKLKEIGWVVCQQPKLFLQ